MLVRVVADADGTTAALEHDQVAAVGLAQRLGGEHRGGAAVLDLAAVQAEHAVPLRRLPHDVRQAGEWDRVLCLHGRQIEYGAPAAVLSPETLRETYGAELIVLEGGGRAVGIGHHAHGH